MLSRAVSVVSTGLLSLALVACGGGSSAGSGESAGGGATTTLKLAFNQTDQHPQYAAGVKLGELLSEATDGRYDVKVYPNEQLGTQQDVLQNMTTGTVAMVWAGGPTLESFNSDFAIFNLPYVFESIEAQTAVLAGGDNLTELYTSLEDSKGLTVLAGVNAGVRNVYNSKKPIRTPEDLNGLKIRVQQSDSQVKMIELIVRLCEVTRRAAGHEVRSRGTARGPTIRPRVVRPGAATGAAVRRPAILTKGQTRVD